MKLYPLAMIAALAACAPEASEPTNEAAVAVNAAVPATAPAATSEAAPPSSAAAILTAEGWSPLRIGMARTEIVAALGDDADPGAVGGPDPRACDQFRPARAPTGMLLMVEDGRLARISLMRDAAIATDRGIRLGGPRGQSAGGLWRRDPQRAARIHRARGRISNDLGQGRRA